MGGLKVYKKLEYISATIDQNQAFKEDLRFFFSCADCWVMRNAYLRWLSVRWNNFRIIPV